jgi:hypothetical protein
MGIGFAGEKDSQHSPRRAAIHKHHRSSQPNHNAPDQAVGSRQRRCLPSTDELVHHTRYLKATPPAREQRRSATASQTEALGFHQRQVGQGGRGYNFDVAFKKENNTDNIVDVMAAIVDQWFP